MSRIGKKPITIPKDVTVQVDGKTIRVKGPKGELMVVLHPVVSATVRDVEGGKEVVVEVKETENQKHRALWGLFRALIQNTMVGVTQGYSKQLEVNGIGFRVAQSGDKLTFELGFSHPVVFPIPTGVEAKVEKNMITLRSIDKQLLGEIAAQIRKLRPPEPYKGKGIKYADEVIRRKAGKAVKSAA